ncbi:phage tail domain-containing protein [Lactiplantibacillus plantarum]|uniref:phage tail domain-containing protein n=1 Tax=Lactiplantibacillus plantarum TaxID=1590 RepID=UPI001F4D035C|nr:phage tail domain-containing protein [Lactiplantibacillus plantarum]MCH8632304.1 phage tail family protein [Lactiplantibacillus plantarum]MCH8635359.1 phage tail family protein [Lactiplantibacillus plantarum]
MELTSSDFQSNNILSIGTLTNYDMGFLVNKFTRNLTPDITENTQTIPGRVGLGYMSNSYGGLQLTAECTVIADKSDDVYQIMRDISEGLWSDKADEEEQPITWSGDNNDGIIVYFGHVTDVSTPSWTDEASYYMATFTITFKCSDPHGFGAQHWVYPRYYTSGKLLQLSDDALDIKTVASSNYLEDTVNEVGDDTDTQRDYGSDDYAEGVAVESASVADDFITDAQGSDVQLQFDYIIDAPSTTAVTSSDATGDATATTSVGSTSEVYATFTVTYSDGTTQDVTATIAIDSPDGTSTYSGTATGTATLSSTLSIASVSDCSLYINLFAERVTLSDLQLMIQAQPTATHFNCAWNSDADSVSNTFNVQLAEYDSSGALVATNTVATVTPDADDTDEYGNYEGAVDTDFSWPTLNGATESLYLYLSQGNTDTITIDSFKFYATNSDATITTLFDDADTAYNTQFILTDSTTFSVTPDGNATTEPVFTVVPTESINRAGIVYDDAYNSKQSYSYVGEDVDAENGTEAATGDTLILHDPMDTRNKWSTLTSTSFELENSSVDGKMATLSTSGFRVATHTAKVYNSSGSYTNKKVANFGTAKNHSYTDFYGPVVMRTLSTAPTDWQVDVRMSMHVKQSYAKGKIEFYLLDEDGARHGKIMLKDNTDSGKVMAQLQIGTHSAHTHLYEGYGKTTKGKTSTKTIKYYDSSTTKKTVKSKVRYSASKIKSYKATLKKLENKKKLTTAQKKQLKKLKALSAANWYYTTTSSESVAEAKTVTTPADTSTSSFSDFYGLFRIRKVGNKYTYKIEQLDSTTHKTKKNGFSTSGSKTLSSSYAFSLAKIAMHTAKMNINGLDTYDSTSKGNTVYYKNDVMSGYDLKVYQAVDTEDVTPIADSDNTLKFDFQEHKIYKDDAEYMDKLSIGSSWPSLQGGEETEIAISPTIATANWAMTYRPTYK